MNSTSRPPREYRTSAFSRERNRMHARKTRQRKKEHMQKLQNRADELKLEQIRLKQAINEKNTASILVGLFSGDGSESDNGANNAMDPRVEALLKRSIEDIPDASKIPELPALILPGQHNSKKKNSSDDEDTAAIVPEELQEDGIDYALLGKDRSVCSPAELDQIRRERNRMHAKRTRDRKRIFMEEMEVMIKQLEDENALLQAHINQITEGQPSEVSAPTSNHIISPLMGPVATASTPASAPLSTDPSATQVPQHRDGNQTKGDFLNQIESLLAAAGAFEKRRSLGEINAVSCAESDVTTSTNQSEHNSLCEEDDQYGCHPIKKPRIDDVPTPVPSSITTTNISHL
mmetsp:Transcript_17015/g.35503  ORF Transcript_17015/g.35503 Transcript_17015/m.35503 type:complete len:347 (+) Transcript_17015:1672-2712(+)